MPFAVFGPRTRLSGVSRVTAMTSLDPDLQEDAVGAAAVPGELDGGVLGCYVPADDVSELLLRADDQGGHLAAGGQQPVEEIAGHGGGVGADDDDVALGRAQDVTGVTAARRGQGLLLGDGDLGPPGRRSGLGHGDDVVPEPA